VGSEEGANEYDRIIQQYEQAHPDKAYRDSLQFHGHDKQGWNGGNRGRSASAPEEFFAFDWSPWCEEARRDNDRGFPSAGLKFAIWA